MNTRKAGLAVAVACFAAALWFALWPGKNGPVPSIATGTSAPVATPAVPPTAVAPSRGPGSVTAPAAVMAPTPLPPRAIPFVTGAPPNPANDVAPAATGNGHVASTSLDPQVELGKVRVMFRDYHTLEGENPVGTNAEIMSAIMGDNKRHARLGPPEGMSMNGQGELVDQWNTPYFFHQLSKDVMEIRSAGPDKVMYTADDVLIR